MCYFVVLLPPAHTHAVKWLMLNLRTRQLSHPVSSLRLLSVSLPRLTTSSEAIDCGTKGRDLGWPPDYQCIEYNYLLRSVSALSSHPFTDSLSLNKNSAKPMRQKKKSSTKLNMSGFKQTLFTLVCLPIICYDFICTLVLCLCVSVALCAQACLEA